MGMGVVCGRLVECFHVKNEVMRVIDKINNRKGPLFSFEVLPPLKGTSIGHLFHTIDLLYEMNPAFINITNHRSEYVYRDQPDGSVRRLRIRRRPGTTAVAAAIKQHYDICVVPHLLCSGYTREETEYQLIDMQFLGISDVLVLRGDKAKEDSVFRPTGDGYVHATDLIEYINRFNDGEFFDGSIIKEPGEKLSFGVACYPEKHEEAANPEADLMVLKRKADMGAQYAITQLFFDNEKYFDFVQRARALGIEIPIIPGIKPLSKLSQISVVPRTFRCDFPEALAHELQNCKNDGDVRRVGLEWALNQCSELVKHGVPGLHFYTVSAAESVREVARRIF